MKKLVIVLAILIVVLSLSKNSQVMIPRESIRFRVIANSNKEEDQNIKKKIVNNLKNEIASLKFIPKNLNSSRTLIKSQIPTFSKIVEKTLKEEGNLTEYTIQYGKNYFPEKQYKGVTYEEGEYESLVITLGNGLGENFWCVLFPPLCLLEAEDEQTNKVEYTSFIKEIIDKYF